MMLSTRLAQLIFVVVPTTIVNKGILITRPRDVLLIHIAAYAISENWPASAHLRPNTHVGM
jgi:hypothetical protein